MARFIAVGIGATLTYLAVSLGLLRAGIAPQTANLIAFVFSTSASYLGHYYFTYRLEGSHLAPSARFLAVTLLLSGVCAVLHQLVLVAGATPQVAAYTVAIVWPGASFVLNHFWSFARGAGTRAP